MSNALILAAKDPLGHNYDYPILSYNNWAILTNHIVIMIGVAIFMLWFMPWVGRAVERGNTGTSHDYVTKNPFAHMVEVVCVFFRDDIAKPVLGPFTDRFMPLIWTFFFFILFNNLVGMVPLLDITSLTYKGISGVFGEAPVAQVELAATAATELDAGEHHTVWKIGPLVAFQDLTQTEPTSHFHGFGGAATGNIAVTFALALISIFFVIFSAIKNLGFGGFLHHLTLDAPVALWPLTVMLEIIGLIAKPFALMVRLFANLTAGHVMLGAILGFTSLGWNGFVTYLSADGQLAISIGGLIGFIPVALVSAAFATAISLLEVLVAFIQAFVFAFLSTIFIGMFLPHENHDEEHHHHEESSATPATA